MDNNRVMPNTPQASANQPHPQPDGDTPGTPDRKIFVKDGKPLAVHGAATQNMVVEENALVIPPDHRWGNPLFADASLEETDFHIHARLTLDKLEGTGASFLVGGFYHYPCSRPEGNHALRISLDEYPLGSSPVRGKFSALDADTHIVHGMTPCRAPWRHAEKTVAAVANDFIKPGQPFDLDIRLEGQVCRVAIDGREVFQTPLRENITGPGDRGWPVCFGVFPDRGVIRIHELGAEGVFSKTDLDHRDVWLMGHHDYCTYRIPSICLTPNGALLAFCEARRFDWPRAGDWDNRLEDEVHCVMKRSTDGGNTWSEQKKLLGRGPVYEARDPSPLVDVETGELFLMTRGPYLMKTKDDGETWSEPISLRHLLPDGLDALTPGPCRGIQLRGKTHSGRLMYALYGSGTVAGVYSDDHGATWHLGGVVADQGGCEPQIVELADGKVVINARNHSDNPGRLIATSNDGGLTFETRYDAALPCKKCQATLLRCPPPGGSPEGHVGPLLFCGPAVGRTKLTFMASHDEGQTWPLSREVYSGSSEYSAAVVLPDGQLGVLYEKDKYRRLVFVKVPLDWLEKS